ncbi:TolC family protein [Herbaspirillum sp. NPDC087042]|uniref:TolC family protein n=1 Tax=Herbaspirillum sp. NPDC087042 TaxID=3364004 RepID=UPI0038018904
MNDNTNKHASPGLRRHRYRFCHWHAPAFCLALLAWNPDASAITLDELVKAAAYNNPSALSRQRAAEAAAEGVSSAQWQFFPTPSVSVERAGTSGSRDISYGGDASVVILRLQQTLWSGGRLTAQLEQAQQNQQSAEEAVREQRFRLAEQVISQYSLWLRSDLASTANQKNLAALENFLEQSRRREKEGAAAKVDVTLVQGRRDQALTDLLAAKAARQSARLQLEQLVGLPLADAELRTDVEQAPTLEDLPALTESALASSPLLKRLRADAQVQESAIKVRQAAYWPEVYARLEHQRGNYSVSNQPSSNRGFIGMQMQLGAGLSLGSEVDAARGRYQSALLAVDAARLELISQIGATYTEYQQAIGRAGNLEDVARSAEEVQASYTRQYLSGRRSWLDVMNAVREVVQTDLQKADVTAMSIADGRKLLLWAYGIDRLR